MILFPETPAAQRTDTGLIIDPFAVQTCKVHVEIPFVELAPHRLTFLGLTASSREEAVVFITRAFQYGRSLFEALASGLDIFIREKPGAPAQPYRVPSLRCREQLGEKTFGITLAERIADALAAFARMVGQRTADDALASMVAHYATLRHIRKNGGGIYAQMPVLTRAQ